MINADVLYLAKDTPDPHGHFEQHTTELRKVFCEVHSVTRTEAYAAMTAGHTPSYVFRIPRREEYKDERTVLFHGVAYDVIRTFTDGDAVELTAERARDNG